MKVYVLTFDTESEGYVDAVFKHIDTAIEYVKGLGFKEYDHFDDWWIYELSVPSLRGPRFDLTAMMAYIRELEVVE